MKKTALMLLLMASGFAHAEFAPREISYGWQGAGNYITAKQLSAISAGNTDTVAGRTAACTLELAQHTFREVNTKGVTEFLAGHAMKLSEMSHRNGNPGTFPELPGTPRLYHEKWQELQALKAPYCPAAVALANCAEVQLAGAEYEVRENYPRHAQDFLKRYEDLKAQAEAEAQSCTPPQAEPVSRPVNISADALFDFGSYKLKDTATLDEFAFQMMSVRIQGLTVTGHTDYFGSDAYNMKLSQKRAEAVRDYLAEKTGIRGEAVGMGESQPMKQCAEKSTKAQKVCLQPNRRVEITLHGQHQK